MENPKKPNFRRLAIIGVLFIIISTMLLFWARDFVREVVVLPLSYIFWVAGILVDLTPQFYFWIVVLVITFMIAYPSLSRKKKEPLSAPTKYVELADQPTSGRTSYWLNRVNLLRSGRGVFYTHTFHIALGRLLVDMLAYRYRLSARQVEDRLRDGALDLPRDVREFALESLSPLEIPQGGLFAWYWSQLLAFAQKRMNRLQYAYRNFMHSPGSNGRHAQSTSTKSYAQSIDRGTAQDAENPRASSEELRVINVIKYMEEELEVQHDDTGH